MTREVRTPRILTGLAVVIALAASLSLIPATPVWVGVILGAIVFVCLIAFIRIERQNRS